MVLGFDPGQDAPAERLQRAFGIDRARADALLDRLPATVQRAVVRVRAEYFRRALIAIGAQVELRSASGAVVVSDTEPPEPAPRPSVRPKVVTSAGTAAALPGASSSQPAPPRVEARASGPTWIDAAAAFGSAATDAPPPPATPPLAWGPPAEVATELRATDPMNATLAQLGGHRPADLRSFDRPEPRSVAPVARPVAATLREAVPAPVFTAPEPEAAPARFAAIELPAAAAWGAPGSIGSNAPAFRGGASIEPQLHASRDPSSVFDPPPAQARHAPRPQAVTLPPTDPAPPLAQAVERGFGLSYGDLAALPARDAAAAVLASAGYASLGAGAAASAPAALMFDLTPIAAEPWEAGPALAEQRAMLPLDTGEAQLAQVLRAWEQPDETSMAEPKVSPSRAPAGRARPRQDPRQRVMPDSLRAAQGDAANSGAPHSGRPHSGPPHSGAPHSGRPHSGAPHSARPSRAAAVQKTRVPDRVQPRARSAYDPRSFWETIGEALVLPFTGPGIYWIAAIAVWSVGVGLIGMLCRFMFVLGLAVLFVANTSLLAFACDYYRVCLWPPIVGEKALDTAPSLDPLRIGDRYIKSGIHLSLFAIASQLPVIAWLGSTALDGRALLDTLTNPITWVLFAFPYVYWPMGVALTALANDFSKIWNLPAGIRAIARAPLEYITVVVIGFAALAVSWIALLTLGTLMGTPAVVVSSTMGISLAISHGIQGALMGHLARARAEVFE